MTKILAQTAIAFLIASTAQAETRIDTLCGSGHRNEIAGAEDVRTNPGGYFIVSLRLQLSHGDPRIQFTAGDTFHLCTTSAATPDMETSQACSCSNTARSGSCSCRSCRGFRPRRPEAASRAQARRLVGTLSRQGALGRHAYGPWRHRSGRPARLPLRQNGTSVA